MDGIADRLPRARLLQRAYADAAKGFEAPRGLRPLVLTSWDRSRNFDVDPLGLPPVVLAAAAARQRLAHHPLGPALGLLAEAVDATANARQVLVLADAEGLVLWTAGDDEMLVNARAAHLQPGAVWSEQAAGTNALGTGLTLDHPVQIFAAEHFTRLLHPWSSSAAPIHEIETGGVLAVVGVWGPFQAAHPHGLSLVVVLAGLLEAHLRHASIERDERLQVEYLERVAQAGRGRTAVVNASGRVLRSTPAGWLGRRLALSPQGLPITPRAQRLVVEPLGDGDGFLIRDGDATQRRLRKPRLSLRALGRERALVSLDGRELELTPRQSEILVILALHRGGLTDEALCAALYPSARVDVTVRAAVCRLRKLLGPVITPRPYQLDANLSADFLDLEQRLTQAHAAAAPEPGAPALLPRSRAPAIVAARERIERALRG